MTAQEREEKWAPKYVGGEMEAVSLAEARAREAATVLGAKADAVTTDDPQRAAVLREEALLAAGQLAAMEGQRTALERSDLDRAKWTVANAPTKDRAEAARDELAARGIDLANPPDRTTAAEWVQAHRAEQVVEDSVRAVTDEIDLVDPQRDADQAAMDAVSPVTGPVEETGVVETAVADIRDTAEADAGEHTDPDERRRVPPLAETRETVERAQEAVAELAAREVLDEAADTPELGGAVARWDDGTDDVRDHTMGNEIPEVVVPDVPDYQDADA